MDETNEEMSSPGSGGSVTTSPQGRPMRQAKQGALQFMSRAAGGVNIKRTPVAAIGGQHVDSSPADDDQSGSDMETPAGRGRGRKRRLSREETITETFTVTSRRGRGAGSARGTRGGRGRGRGRGSVIGASYHRAPAGEEPTFGIDDNDGSLFSTVKNVRGSLKSVVDDWISDYEQDKDAAVRQLLQFFIHACGCKGKIPDIRLTNQDVDYSGIIRKVTEEFDEESGDYPLIISGPTWRKFKQHFCDFIHELVKSCQNTIIYDQVLMDSVISLLTGLADSQVRAFRHTATLAAMKLQTALVEVIQALCIQHDKYARLYQNEAKKDTNRREEKRINDLLEKKRQLDDCMEEIKNMLQYIFKSVFIHRYRDILPEIRSICVHELGIWMQSFPLMFLDDSYLKYIGWTMSDKHPDVRLKCLEALLPLYEEEQFADRLELFTNKFKDRIVAMSLDVQPEVGVKAVHLVTAVFLNLSDKEILQNTDCETLYELVYTSNRSLATAAGKFVCDKLFQPLDDASLNMMRNKRGEVVSPNAPLLRDLTLFFIESELHEHAAYLVDALIDHHPMIKDWKCMTDLLLEGDPPLTDRQEAYLIEILRCAAKQAATGEPPVGRAQKKYVITQKEKDSIQQDRDILSDHFIQTLPALLTKFIADQEKVVNLLDIPLYFNIELYTKGRHEKALDMLLARLNEVLDKHHDNNVLLALSKVYAIFCDENSNVRRKCEAARDRVIDGLVLKYRDAIKAFLDSGGEVEDEDLAVLEYVLRKIAAFYENHDLSQCNLWDSLMQVISIAKDDPKFHEVLRYALRCCHFSLLWELHAVETEHGGSANDQTFKLLKKHCKQYVTLCEQLMRSGKSTATTAFNSLADILIMFGPQLGEGEVSNPDALKSLQIVPDAGLRNLMGTFTESMVFVDDENEDNAQDSHKQIELLHERRNLLSAFCKLIAYNVFPMISCAKILKYFHQMFYNDYGDILKMTLGKCREMNKSECGRVIVAALKEYFEDLKKDLREATTEDERSAAIDRFRDGTQTMRDLAKKFALSFGVDTTNKYRDAIAAIHRDGIVYALDGYRPSEGDDSSAPVNLALLEIIQEFTNRLSRQDKRSVLQFLDKKINHGVIARGNDDWNSLLQYRNSLVQTDDTASVASGPSLARAPPSVRGGRGRGGRGRAPSGFNPVATSTTLKPPRAGHDGGSESGDEAASSINIRPSSLASFQR